MATVVNCTTTMNRRGKPVEAVRLATSLPTDLNGNVPNAVHEFLDSPHTKRDLSD